MPDPTPTTLAPPTPQEVELLRLLRGVRYGQVVVQVHDGRLVQIERTERYRTDQRDGMRSA
ncbi:MAG TPA: YezD family protein [Planctomycetota bacterium]|nr:YezD family protein [Planctomycetota bacterium]